MLRSGYVLYRIAQVKPELPVLDYIYDFILTRVLVGRVVHAAHVPASLSRP
jgi:hypothetical protein